MAIYFLKILLKILQNYENKLNVRQNSVGVVKKLTKAIDTTVNSGVVVKRNFVSKFRKSNTNKMNLPPQKKQALLAMLFTFRKSAGRY